MAERLADAPIQRFLATRQVVVLATLGVDGAPDAVPMWFLHDSDALFMLSVAGTTKIRNVRRDARVAVVADAGTRADIRGVTVQGRAELLDDSAGRRALVERFHEKYRRDLERIWGSRTMPANRVMIRIVPERVRSWGLT